MLWMKVYKKEVLPTIFWKKIVIERWNYQKVSKSEMARILDCRCSQLEGIKIIKVNHQLTVLWQNEINVEMATKQYVSNKNIHTKNKYYKILS